MEPSTLNVAPSGTKTQWAKPQDWEKFRNTITALFMCHSLPVVMRVMREEHQFHATPKMFQSQIYQKWGLRKTKPGEAKKEAKERKRRRQDSEDAESVGSDSRSREAADTSSSTAGRSIESTSPTAATHRQTNVESGRVEPSVPSEDGAVPLGTADAVPPAEQPKTRKPDYIVPDLQGAVPKGWKDFLDQSRIHPPPFLPSNNNQDVSSSFVSELHGDDDEPQSAEAMPSARPRSLRSSTKSRRASPNLPETELGLSPPNSAKRARYLARLTEPLGTIRALESHPSDLLPERSMFYARHFISSTYATGVWSLATGDTSRYEADSAKLEHWYNDFNHGFDCLREKKVKKAFRIMKRCFANTKGVIEPQDPRVVIYMCQQTIRCMFYDRLGRNLAQTLLKYIAELCHVIFGAHHPLFIVFSQLSTLGSFEFAQLIRPFMDCYFDHLEPFLENFTNVFGHITEMRGLTTSLMEATGMMGIYEAKPVLDRLILHAQKKNLPTLHLKAELASTLSRNRFFNEALSILRDVRESEEDCPYEKVYAGIILIITLLRMKDLDGAIEVNQELVDELSRPPSTYPGYPDNMTVNWVQYLESRESSLLLLLGKLEKNLRNAGRIEEADRVQKRLDGEIIQEYGVEVDQDPEGSLYALT
ncbi:hypothetical protein PFICI_02636 [Pestalotiopsis fici W106-1]|uniref:Clr5 domain-containing protein n=1 Tax=Pestalotiopsis fici (strain W106-1 / CGMCC3.15140) TaxID=1229662 RepID=W3XHA7_PESFW|nr:uncharacterized protein PFICI_02636 [Pestalotiopsis fici W106-1]ETS84611.1 hypothetical protein PFICI_02636 [Pestalotiopsis fici W106-1]